MVAIRSETWVTYVGTQAWVLSELFQWVGSCYRHRQVHVAMETGECTMKGRHLPVCCETQPRCSRGCVTRSTSRLHLGYMDCKFFMHQCMPATEATFAQGLSKLNCFQRLPFSLGRPDEPGKKPDTFNNTSPALRMDTTESSATSSTRQRALFVETFTHFGKTGLACLIDCVRHECGVLRLI